MQHQPRHAAAAGQRDPADDAQREHVAALGRARPIGLARSRRRRLALIGTRAHERCRRRGSPAPARGDDVAAAHLEAHAARGAGLGHAGRSRACCPGAPAPGTWPPPASAAAPRRAASAGTPRTASSTSDSSSAPGISGWPGKWPAKAGWSRGTSRVDAAPACRRRPVAPARTRAATRAVSLPVPSRGNAATCTTRRGTNTASSRSRSAAMIGVRIERRAPPRRPPAAPRRRPRRPAARRRRRRRPGCC